MMSFFDAPLALEPHCSVLARMGYDFFHANFFHALCNVWCLLAIAFYYNIEDWELLLAYIIACTVPSVAMSSQPIVGASGICFALMGIVLYKVARKRFYLSWVIPVVAVGFVLPGIAAGVHLYCFLVGTTIALVYSMVRKFVIRKRQ